MDVDKRIEGLMAEIEKEVKFWNETVEWLGNQCASTDRVLEKVLNSFEQLKNVYQDRWEE